MTARTKSTLLLLATFLIGGVLGALLNARLAEQRLERIAFLRSQQGFIRFMEAAIEPRDEAQREAVRAVLEKAAARMAEHMERTRREGRMIIDSTRAELKSVLTEEQMEPFEAHLTMRRRGPFGPRGRRPFGPEERRAPPRR